MTGLHFRRLRRHSPGGRPGSSPDTLIETSSKAERETKSFEPSMRNQSLEASSEGDASGALEASCASEGTAGAPLRECREAAEMQSDICAAKPRTHIVAKRAQRACDINSRRGAPAVPTQRHESHRPAPHASTVRHVGDNGVWSRTTMVQLVPNAGDTNVSSVGGEGFAEFSCIVG